MTQINLYGNFIFNLLINLIIISENREIKNRELSERGHTRSKWIFHNNILSYNFQLKVLLTTN